MTPVPRVMYQRAGPLVALAMAMIRSLLKLRRCSRMSCSTTRCSPTESWWGMKRLLVDVVVGVAAVVVVVGVVVVVVV